MRPEGLPRKAAEQYVASEHCFLVMKDHLNLSFQIFYQLRFIIYWSEKISSLSDILAVILFDQF